MTTDTFFKMVSTEVVQIPYQGSVNPDHRRFWRTRIEPVQQDDFEIEIVETDE